MFSAFRALACLLLASGAAGFLGPVIPLPVGRRAAALVMCSATLAAADAGQRLPSARPGDIALTVTLLAKDGIISAHEPLLARIQIRNRCGEKIGLWRQGKSLAVYDSAGKLLADLVPA